MVRTAPPVAREAYDALTVSSRFLLAIKADPLQRLVHLLQRLLAEVRDAQQILAGAMEQVVDRENPPLLQTVRRPDRQADLRRAHLQLVGKVLGLGVGRSEAELRVAHGFPPKSGGKKANTVAAAGPSRRRGH